MVYVLNSYALGSWVPPAGETSNIVSALDGEPVAAIGHYPLDFGAMLDYAREMGGPALRALTFQQRAGLLRALCDALLARKEELYTLSFSTGATRTDSWVDIEGGTGTLYAYASKAKRELPDSTILIDGASEILGKSGDFIGQHIYTSRQGAGVFINAFNFPVWGMLEKLAPCLLAGLPAIIKPGSATAYLTEAAFKIMVEADILPAGAIQLIIGPTGDLFDHLNGQDVVSFTGSAVTAAKLQAHPRIIGESVRFVSERDSLNATVLGLDAGPETPEFELFIKEIVREMTVKAGQKCTAIRRIFAPRGMMDAVEAALKVRLAKVVVGDPRLEGVTMGALVSRAQLADVTAKVKDLVSVARIVFEDSQMHESSAKGAFMSPVLLRQDAPWQSGVVHDVEAFGPVATLMPYGDTADAVGLANRGNGSLAFSLFTFDPAIAKEFIIGAASHHGRMIIINRDCARESTGHGSPLPVLIHGGPGRAGGGEELGGIRGVKHLMQRTALQGHPALLGNALAVQLPVV